ncbi:hypothetical protein TNCV_1570891 [Trichonephila clavipes]|uniref:Uncharacterized protein n=1 Tax=Trichonephila clavipes TaxID=2585209 RepID=A0A8X6VNR4_TRICX|nr:hypothetical protein TNCV_1570891 [Trichonephila clavipes]
MKVVAERSSINRTHHKNNSKWSDRNKMGLPRVLTNVREPVKVSQKSTTKRNGGAGLEPLFWPSSNPVTYYRRKKIFHALTACRGD